MASPIYFFLGFGIVIFFGFIVVVHRLPLIVAIGGGLVGGAILLVLLGIVFNRNSHRIGDWWAQEKVNRQARRVENRNRREQRERVKEHERRRKEEERRREVQRKEEERIRELERRREEAGPIGVEAIV